MLLAPCRAGNLHIEQALDALLQRGFRLLRVAVADRGKVAGFCAHFLHNLQNVQIGAVIQRDMRMIGAGRIENLHPAAVAVLHLEQAVHAAHCAVEILLLLCLLISPHQEPDLRGCRIVVDGGMCPVAGVGGLHALLPAALVRDLILDALIRDIDRLAAAEPACVLFQEACPVIVLLGSRDRQAAALLQKALRHYSRRTTQQAYRTAQNRNLLFHHDFPLVSPLPADGGALRQSSDLIIQDAPSNCKYQNAPIYDRLSQMLKKFAVSCTYYEDHAPCVHKMFIKLYV